jgi:phosphonate transport system substrate-binding protein
VLNLGKGKAGFRQMLKSVLILALIVPTLWACGQDRGEKATDPQLATQAPESSKEYVFAIHPLNNPERLFEICGPLIDYLNRNISGAKFRLEASREYEEFAKKLSVRQPEFALPNPDQTLNSLNHGYLVITRMGDDYRFAGVIVIRRVNW